MATTLLTLVTTSATLATTTGLRPHRGDACDHARHHADDPVGPGASDPVDPGASDLPPLATTQLATVNPTWVRPDWTCQHKSADASGHVRGSGHLAGDPSNAHPRRLLSISLSRRSRGDKHEVSKTFAQLIFHVANRVTLHAAQTMRNTRRPNAHIHLPSASTLYQMLHKLKTNPNPEHQH